jgi:hypothetical protein
MCKINRPYGLGLALVGQRSQIDFGGSDRPQHHQHSGYAAVPVSSRFKTQSPLFFPPNFYPVLCNSLDMHVSVGAEVRARRFYWRPDIFPASSTYRVEDMLERLKMLDGHRCPLASAELVLPSRQTESD